MASRSNRFYQNMPECALGSVEAPYVVHLLLQGVWPIVGYHLQYHIQTGMGKTNLSLRTVESNNHKEKNIAIYIKKYNKITHRR